MAKPFWEKMQAIDRRIIFLFMAAAVIIPLLVPLELGVNVTKRVQSIYDKIEQLKEGSPVLIAADFDPSSAPELYPMLDSVVYHCFRKNHRVVVMTMWLGARDLIEKALDGNAKIFGKVETRDYVFLGFKAGGPAVILSAGQDLKAAYETVEIKGEKTSTADMEVLKDVNKLSDFKYAVALSAGAPGIEEWIIYGSEKYGFKLGAGCTGVMAAENFPYLNAQQINGLMAGLKGAAEYEELVWESARENKTEYEMLVKEKGKGSALPLMDSQAVGHLIIIAFIVLGNIAYFSTRRTKKS